MKRVVVAGLAALSLVVLGSIAVAFFQTQTADESLSLAEKHFADKNFQDALREYRRVLGDAKAESKLVVQALQRSETCLGNLNQIQDLDGLLALATESHSDDFQVLDQAAAMLLRGHPWGVVADGKFVRGYNRGYGRGGVGGTMISVAEQDRLQAIQWQLEAIRIAKSQGLASDSTELGQLNLRLATSLLHGRENQQSWRLQALTDLTAQADYLDLDGEPNPPQRYAPVDDQDQPVLHALPASWQAARSDGERLRWALRQAEAAGDVAPSAQLAWADFLNSQFSVDTLAQDQWLLRSKADDDESGRFAIHTLGENETIARLASGVQRFDLPDEFNPIPIYRRLSERADHSAAVTANQRLVQIFLNRRQYTTAAAIFEEHVEQFGTTMLDSIRKPRIAFDPVPSQLAGQPAKFSLLFRNTEQLQFSARRVDLEKLLADVKQYFRNLNPQQQNRFGGKEGQYLPQLSSPVNLFTAAELDSYLIGESQRWQEAVTSRPNHWDRRQEFVSPLKDAGLFLVEALADDGAHRARCLVWIQDTIIVRKPLDGSWLVHVADAQSGRPLAQANVEFFGYGYQQRTPRPTPVTKNVAVRTDATGQATVELEQDLQWFTVARADDGRLALLDFQQFWRHAMQAQTFLQAKAYGVTDRPVYRPGDTVKAKFWLAHTVYGDAEPPAYINEKVTVSAIDAQGNQVSQKVLTTDQFGGCDLEFDLPAGVGLGRYAFQIQAADPRRRTRISLPTNLAFRVEEYRKPEFEVQVLAPSQPVALGETVNARIQAKYYFGAPVTEAQVTVRVERSTYQDDYYPIAPYDWCYGPGYWWFAEDYTWYPNWRSWAGCFAPVAWWFPRWGFEPPELVLEQQLELDAKGEAVLRIDTALAKAVHGDEDHKYSIHVEVRDASRRTITAEGQVIAAREAFKIYSWTDRGYYNTGDRIQANFHARMLDGTPVQATGTLDLLRITYDAAARPTERVVSTLEVQTGVDGRLSETLSADRSGQYRLRLRLRDEAGHEVEGGYIFTVRGEGASGDDFRYSALELTPDRQQYAAGDTLRLQISADRDDALVMLFVRPSNGVYAKPQIVQLENKSAIAEIAIGESDQPNFFVEAYTIYDGELHSKVREIIVPPAERVLDVALVSDKAEYLPGEDAEVSITVKSPDGKPVVGSCVVAAYDRSLEQIAPDVLPGDIREFFWKWRRNHSVQHTSNAQFVGQPVYIVNTPTLEALGMFGATLADDLDAFEGQEPISGNKLPQRQGRTLAVRGGGYGGGFGGYAESEGMAPMMMRGMAMADAAAPMAAMAKQDAGAEPPAAPQVRKDFADSALWLANLTTDAQGRATAKFKMPENLTGWRLKSWAVGKGTRVGSAQTEAVTRKQLLVRLIAPRFLVERDEAVISTIVHNDLPTAKRVQVKLEIDGETQIRFAPGQSNQQFVEIAAHEQARVDWRLQAIAEGPIGLTASAIADGASDAVQIQLPIVVYGLLKTDSYAGTVRSGQSQSTVSLRIPDQRRVEQSKLTIRVSPSLAASMIDALPYLAEYPYGCTEQTLNRFLPTVITQQVLREMNVDLEQLKARSNNLNAQELGDAGERKEGWKRFEREAVYDQQLVNDMVREGVQRLTDMQCSDGGWGWFSGINERSSPHTTATVVRGLLIAQENGVAIVPDVLQRGLAWLEQYQAAELQKLKNAEAKTQPYKPTVDNVDALVFHVLVLGGTTDVEMQQYLYAQREHLSTYGKALFAWATHRIGNVEQTTMLRRNLEQFLVEDAENETAFLQSGSSWWYWYGSEIEANAMYLKLLAAMDPKGRVAPRLVKFLLNNRKHATYWNSTRDTALVIEAFSEFLDATGETRSSTNVEILLAGKRLGRIEFTPENLFAVNNTIEIHGSAIPSGEQELEIRRSGDGNLYWNAYSANFTLEDEIAPAGLEVKIERRYYRLDPVEKQLQLPGATANVVETGRRGYERVLLEDGQELAAGSLLEVELLVESKNDYEYILIEDNKAACLETVDTTSGYFYSAGLMIYREIRDQRVGLCVRHLPKGSYSIRYQLRSETPGTFTALPATIQGMYAPELAGNAADQDLRIVDAD